MERFGCTYLVVLRIVVKTTNYASRKSTIDDNQAVNETKDLAAKAYTAQQLLSILHRRNERPPKHVIGFRGKW